MKRIYEVRPDGASSGGAKQLEKAGKPCRVLMVYFRSPDTHRTIGEARCAECAQAGIREDVSWCRFGRLR